MFILFNFFSCFLSFFLLLPPSLSPCLLLLSFHPSLITVIFFLLPITLLSPPPIFNFPPPSVEYQLFPPAFSFPPVLPYLTLLHPPSSSRSSLLFSSLLFGNIFLLIKEVGLWVMVEGSSLSDGRIKNRIHTASVQ